MTAESRVVLMVNVGSSSVKYQLVEPDSDKSLADGVVEEIGERSSSAWVAAGDRRLERREPIADHDAALRLAFELLTKAGIDLKMTGLVAVGHRVVHEGMAFRRPTLVDDEMIATLKALSSLASIAQSTGRTGY